MSVVVAAVLVCGVATSAQAQAVRFVDDDAPPGGNGQSWQTAYRFLQDAFFDAAADPSIAEIRVAQGVYKPDRDEAGNVTAGDREASFQLRSGLALLGGFRGSGSGGDRDDRDIAAFETILSGDLAGDDEHVEDLSTMLEAPSRAENSLRVLTCSNTDDTAVLAGFTVTGGNTDTRSGARGGSGAGLLILQAAPTISECRFIENAAYPPFDDVGGGALANFVGSPTVQRCIFTRNAAGEGGALYITNFGTTIVADCTFADNWAIMGGAVVNAGGSSIFRDCVFERNVAEFLGGGLLAISSRGTSVIDCLFLENQADFGGGTYYGSPPVPFLRNEFIRNVAYSEGGGMYGGGAIPMKDCWFEGNRSGGCGGAMMIRFSTTLENCVFLGNHSTNGGGISNFPALRTQSVVRNCVFVGNVADDQTDLLKRSSGTYPTRCTIGLLEERLSGGGIHNMGRLDLMKCDFIENEAEKGGAFANEEGFSNIAGCTFSRNWALKDGGALHNSIKSLLMMSLSEFSENSASRNGGAIYNRDTEIRNTFGLRILRNSAGGHGGALYNADGAVRLVGSLIVANTAEGQGGGVYDGIHGFFRAEDCTLVANSASIGGALVAVERLPRLRNCIVWANSDQANSPVQVLVPADSYALPWIQYTSIQDEDPDDDTLPFGGAERGNIDDDPLFVDPLGPDGVAGTEDDDFRLMAGSPCIDAGNNYFVLRDEFNLDGDDDYSERAPLDLDGLPRFIDDARTPDTGFGECRIVDMGAFEFQGRTVPPQLVVLCHKPGGDGEGGRTIFVPEEAVAEHLAHGDRPGPCNGCASR